MTDTVLWTAQDALVATGGRTSEDWSATGVSIDSRTVQRGDLFVALQGPNFDGHDFLAAAYDKGAVATMVQRAPGGRLAELPHLLVDDTLGALWRLGAAARARSQGWRSRCVGEVRTSPISHLSTIPNRKAYSIRMSGKA